MLLASIAVPIVLAVVAWRRPLLPLYVLVGAAVALEIFPLGFQDGFTDTTAFFLNLNNTAGAPISASPADLTVFVALVVWWRAYSQDRSLRPSGPLLKAYLVYLGALAMAEVHGLAAHGDFNITLWELRPQLYGFVVFLLASSLVRERRQLLVLGAIFLAAATFKVGVGYNRFFNTLHGDLGTAEAILAHEDSYFLALLVVAAVVALVWHRRRWLVLTLVATIPFAVLVMLENHRRVGVLALGAALIVVTLLGIRFEAGVRGRLIALSLVAAVAYGGFLAAYWNHEYGVASQLVRPIHSLFEPDQRDFNSNLYRQNEDANLIFTYQSSPVIGVGFGLPMDVVFPLADISQQYPFWQYIPHNSILWIAMRMGMVGLITFWGVVGMALLQAMRVLRTTTEPLVRGVLVFAMAAVIGELIVAYGDVQLENYRNLIFFGCMLGLINGAERIRQVAPAAADWARVPAAPPSPMGYAGAGSYTPGTASIGR